MAIKITDIEISCDTILDEAIFSDVNQEIGFLGDNWFPNIDYLNYEEQKDFLVTPVLNEDPLYVLMEAEEAMDQLAQDYYGICEVCNGTGQIWDVDPHTGRNVSCDNCNGTGNTKEQNA